jgi:serine/threonine-protein kinase
MADLIGRTLGPYKLEAKLGGGGMADVYRAYQASVKRYIAIKVMLPEIANQPGFVERFEREAEVIASLEHPHILPVIDYGNFEGIHYLVMRYIEGGSLDNRMRQKPLSLQECSRMMSQMASALDYAHKRGVIHRDLKPNNVLLDASENVYLTDFGIARLTQSDHKLTATGSVMGTPAYMSPEQGMGRTVDARSDIYTLGVVLYEMVLNRLPFAGDTPAALIFQHVYEQPLSPKQLNPELPDAIAVVLNRSMAKNPDDRYQSAGELAEAFNEALRSPSIKPHQTLGSEITRERTFVAEPGTPGTLDFAKSPPAGFQATIPEKFSAAEGQAAAAPRPATTQRDMFTAGEAQAVPKRSPVGLIVGIIGVIAVALIGGALFAINANNVANANATGTSTAVTAAAIAVAQTDIARSWTPTPTSTSTPTETPTNTPTHTPTNTPDASQTALVVQLTAAAQTFTAIADKQTQTAEAQQATQAAIASKTANARATRTAIAFITATFNAQPTRTRTATRTRTSTAAPTGDNLTGAPEEVVGQLAKAGQIPTTAGSVVLTKNALDILAEKPSFNYWDRLDQSVVVTDFVLSAEVTWDAPDAENECGLLFRYTEPASAPEEKTYYVATVTRQGKFRVLARDKQGYRSSPIIEQDSVLIESDDGATNRLVLVGIGSQFRFFVNGKLAGSFTEDAYTSGNVGVMAGRYERSSGLTCKFRNIWAYKLEAAKSLVDSLNSSNPDDVIAGLKAANLISGSSPRPLWEASAEVSIKATESPSDAENGYFRVSGPVSQSTYRNFVLSTDVTSRGSTQTQSLSCGIYFKSDKFESSKVPDNMYTIFIDRKQTAYLYLRQDGSRGSAIATQKADGINPGIGRKNRLTLVVKDGNVTFFINGIKVLELEETTLEEGWVGYYIEKFRGNTVETCSFADTYVWRLN